MKTYIKFLESFEKELKEKIKKKGLTIVVAGPACSGKTTGAKAIAKALNLQYVSAGEVFRNVAKERGIPLEEFSAIREKEIDYEIDKKTLEFAIQGNCVLDGRLVAWVAGDWADVKIYYDCPLEVRAERAIKRDKIPKEKAIEIIKKRDSEDNKKYIELYGIDSFNKSIYDIIIDNEKISKEESEKIAVEKTKEFLKKKLTK